MADPLDIRRKEAGWYEARLPDGEVFEIVNMEGESVLHSGVEPHWHIRRPGGATGGWTAWTLREAKDELRRYWSKSGGES